MANILNLMIQAPEPLSSGVVDCKEYDLLANNYYFLLFFQHHYL